MNRLYIVRHGIAVPRGTEGIADAERPLTPKGVKQLRKVARGLVRLGVAPEAIVSSPLPRALGTAEILAVTLECPRGVECNDALRADRDASTVRDWLLLRSEPTLLIVGHEPILSELIGLLVDGHQSRSICDLDKGGSAALARDGAGVWRLEWLLTARMARRLR